METKTQPEARREGRLVFHVDMDAFFASVEQHDHPEYRGKPLIIGGLSGRGVVSTCSYEARRYGVHSAMPMTQAQRRCPQAIFLPGNYARYGEVSAQIFEIFAAFAPVVEPLSIDEAFLDVTGTELLSGSPRAYAVRLKEEIRRQTGLVASVGIAPNKFLAKIASDLEKPDGLVVVPPDAAGVRAFLWPLPVSRIWGVGKKTEQHLLTLRVRTVGDLAKLPEALQQEIYVDDLFQQMPLYVRTYLLLHEEGHIIAGHPHKRDLSQELEADSYAVKKMSRFLVHKAMLHVMSVFMKIDWTVAAEYMVRLSDLGYSKAKTMYIIAPNGLRFDVETIRKYL